MKRMLILALAVASTMACGTSNDRRGDVLNLLWDTSGGGDLHFTVTRSSPDFQVVVTARQFQARNVTIPLTAADQDAYRLVEDIFTGRTDLHQDTFVPSGPTGSWTSITLVHSDGGQETVKNIDATGRLRPVSAFVEARLGPA